MASQKAKYLRCAEALVTATYYKYASFLGIHGALILNFLLYHPKLTYHKAGKL